jgi:hypothetical protein
MYLTVFLDWYSSYVVSWAFSDSLSADFVFYGEILEELQAGGGISEGIRESSRSPPLDGGVHTAL